MPYTQLDCLVSVMPRTLFVEYNWHRLMVEGDACSGFEAGVEGAERRRAEWAEVRELQRRECVAMQGA